MLTNENIYQDFDADTEPQMNQGKKKNTFVYETFNERMKKIKVRFANNFQNDISFLDVKSDSNNLKISDDESNFLEIINREKVLNATPEFTEILSELKAYTGSFLLIINNSQKIIKILSSTLSQQINSSNQEGELIDRLKENALNQRNYPFIISVLEITIGLVKDLRQDAADEFLFTILPNLIKLLTSTNNTELIDKIFSVFVNIFKFLNKTIQKNFNNFFLIFSELIFHKNKSIRKFSCESICFLIKNLEKAELENNFKIIFGIFKHPEIIFSQEDQMQIDDFMDLDDERFKKICLLEFSSPKEYLDLLISNEKINNRDLFVFMVDCLSDLLMELLIGINKTLSIRADLILEKVSSCFMTSDRQNYLSFVKDLTVSQTILKLYSFINDKQTKDVLALFNYYILILSSENSEHKLSNLTFPKFNLENFSKQVNKISTNILSLKSRTICLIFISEFIKKFYKSLESKTLNYIFDLIVMLNNYEGENNFKNCCIIEISSILIKIYPEEFCAFLKIKEDSSLPMFEQMILKNFSSSNTNMFYLDYFIQNLKLIQSFPEFSSLVYFQKKKLNPYYENDDYDSSYNPEVLLPIFDKILNEIDLVSAERVLNMITSYEYLQKDKTQLVYKGLNDNLYNFSSLKLRSETNLKYIKNHEENLNMDYNLDSYMHLYTYIIKISMLKTGDLEYDKLIKGKVLEHLVQLVENQNSDINNKNPFNIYSILSQLLNEKNYVDTLLSEFKSENIYYLSKTSSLLNLLSKFIHICEEALTEDLTQKIIKISITNKSHAVSYKILNFLLNKYPQNNEIIKQQIREISLHNNNTYSDYYVNTLQVLLSKDDDLKIEYLNFIQNIKFAPYYEDIFPLIRETLSIVFNLKNDKQYKFNFEVLMSKVESLSPTQSNYEELLLFIFYYLIGSYWIRYTKSVWGTITKSLERLYDLVKSNQNLKNHINRQIVATIKFIKTVGTTEDLITRYGKESDLIKENYLIFINDDKSISGLKQNLVNLTFLSKQDGSASLSLLYEGYLQSLPSYSILLNTDVNLMSDYLNYVLSTLSQSKLEYSFPMRSDESQFFFALYNNFILDKEHKSGILSSKLDEALLLTLSKTNLNLKEDISPILYQQIVNSKSQVIQKYCLSILINIEDKLKPYQKLLESIIDNTNVIERLHNLQSLRCDNGNLIKKEEREVLIPLITRLYYSKYFYLSADNKKLRTKNKINLVSFFIQLEEEEFQDYVQVLFQPLHASLKNYKQIILDDYSSTINVDTQFVLSNFDLRAYKKVLEILSMNLKQITSLFSNSINFISSLIKNVLIFIKNLENFIKSSESDSFFTNFHQSLLGTEINNTRFLAYYNKEEVSVFINFFQKNLKEVKKESFALLKAIFTKFHVRGKLISEITSDICRIYSGKSLENLHNLNKPNSILNFFFSFAKIPQLHFLYIENKEVFIKIIQMLSNENLENMMLKYLLEFLENILTPYNSVAEKKDEQDSEDEAIEISQQELKKNEELLITFNFMSINESLLSLVKNEKVHLTIKDTNTKKLIEILVLLWNMFKLEQISSIKQESVTCLLSFLIRLLKKDNKIFKYENRETLSDLLKICHLLLKIQTGVISFGIDTSYNYNNTPNCYYYRDFLKLLYRIEDNDSNNKLLLTILLQEFDDIYNDKEKFANILTYISSLHLQKQKGKSKLLLDENETNLDIDNTIDKLNELKEEEIQKFSFYHLEPLIYTLLVMTRSKDYTLQTISISKLKMLFSSVKNLNELLPNDEAESFSTHLTSKDQGNVIMEPFYNSTELSSNYDKEAMKQVFLTMFEIFDSGRFLNQSLCKTILEVLSHINLLAKNLQTETNQITPTKYLCADLFNLCLDEKTESESQNLLTQSLIDPFNQLKDDSYKENFFSSIFNIKYDLRVSALKLLNIKIPSLSYFSLSRVVLPIIKNFLSPLTYINKKIQISAHQPRESEINKVIFATLDCLPKLCTYLIISDAKELLIFFQTSIEKMNKNNKSLPEDIPIELQSVLYKGIAKVIQTLNDLYFSSLFNFDLEFNRKMRESLHSRHTEKELGMDLQSIEDKSTYENRELFKKVFESLSFEFSSNKRRIESYAEYEVLNLLRNRVFKTIKGILFDTRKKEKGRSYYIRNYVISPYITLLKLLDPHQVKYELISLNYELINNLKNRELTVREKAREGLKLFLDSTSVFTLSMILDEIKSQLHSGYQRYIKGFTTNYLISLISNASDEDLTLELNFASSFVVPILLDELFGEVAEEKEIEILVNKYKEAKQSKSLNTFYIIASKVHIQTTLINLIYPFWAYLMQRDNDTAVFSKVQEVLNHIIKGLKNNTKLNFEDIVNYSNALIKMGIDMSLKNSREIYQASKVQMKGDSGEIRVARKSFKRQNEELMSIQLGAVNGKNYSLEISEKFVSNKNEIVLSNLFTAMGLEIFSISIKKKLFDMEGLAENQFTQEKLTIVLENAITCLEISNSLILSRALKILTSLFECKLPIIKKNLRKIVKHCFRNLNLVNSQDITLAQTILSSIGDILHKFKYTEISENKLKMLLNFIKLNASSTQIKPYVYSCFLSVVKRKILHPSVYDMINFICENYLTAFDENTLTLCQNIFIEFIRVYPLEESRVISHMNFFVVNLESPSRKCIINSLKMLLRVFKEFYAEDKKDFINNIVDFLIIKLLTMLTNEDDAEVKTLIKTLVEVIFENIEREKEEAYYTKITNWLQSEDLNLLRLSLNFVSVYLNSEKERAEKSIVQLSKEVLNLIEREVNKFQRDMFEKLEKEDYTAQTKDAEDLNQIFNTSEKFEKTEITVFNLKLENWDILYLSLLNLEKLVTGIFCSNIVRGLENYVSVIIKCLEHPHVFVKTTTMRLIQLILTGEKNLASKLYLTEDIISFLFVNFKFFLVNKETTDKLFNLTVKNSTLLVQNISQLKNTQLFNLSLEFVCKVYMETKSLFSDKTQSSVILARVFSFYENLILDLNKVILESYLDPIISLCCRVSANPLIEEEAKTMNEKILNLLNSKVDPELVATKYKNIRDNISSLKRKRKVDLVQNSLSNPKEYIKKKYKLK